MRIIKHIIGADDSNWLRPKLTTFYYRNFLLLCFDSLNKDCWSNSYIMVHSWEIAQLSRERRRHGRYDLIESHGVERRHERWAQINLSLQPFSRLFTAISVSIQCGGLCERQPSSQTGLLPPRASWLACRDAPGACFDLWTGTTWLMVGRYDTIREAILTCAQKLNLNGTNN